MLLFYRSKTEIAAMYLLTVVYEDIEHVRNQNSRIWKVEIIFLASP